MNHHDIELPPLPEGFKSYEFPYGGFDDDEMRNYARAAVEAAAQSPEVQALRKDAERYRWLRQQHWSDSEICVVTNPKQAVMLGHECPSLDRLDAAIDHARRIEGNMP